MPPIDTRLTGPIGRIEAVSLNLRARVAGGETSDKPVPAETAEASSAMGVVLGDALGAGENPIDGDRVTQIRKALEKGTYPILPTTVADAIIAAGLILRSPR